MLFVGAAFTCLFLFLFFLGGFRGCISGLLWQALEVVAWVSEIGCGVDMETFFQSLEFKKRQVPGIEAQIIPYYKEPILKSTPT